MDLCNVSSEEGRVDALEETFRWVGLKKEKRGFRFPGVKYKEKGIETYQGKGFDVLSPSFLRSFGIVHRTVILVQKLDSKRLLAG